MADGAIISPQEAMQGQWAIVDVRSATERSAECVPHSMHLPLETVESGAAHLQKLDQPIALLCQGGTRAKLAQEKLAHCGVEASVIEGGISRWRREGLPLERHTYSTWSLERQVRFAAGLLVLLGTFATVFVSHYFLWLTGFVGCGLTFAGASGTCLMGNLLASMPWNQHR